jgi:hypothetical protein
MKKSCTKSLGLLGLVLALCMALAVVPAFTVTATAGEEITAASATVPVFGNGDTLPTSVVDGVSGNDYRYYLVASYYDLTTGTPMYTGDTFLDGREYRVDAIWYPREYLGFTFAAGCVFTINGATATEASRMGEIVRTTSTFSLGTIVPVCTAHDWVVLGVSQPTLLTEGYTVYKCTICGVTKQDDFTPILSRALPAASVTVPEYKGGDTLPASVVDGISEDAILYHSVVKYHVLASFYDVTDNKPMYTGDSFVDGNVYQVNLMWYPAVHLDFSFTPDCVFTANGKTTTEENRLGEIVRTYFTYTAGASTPACSHDWINDTAKETAATCEVAGWMPVICADCGDPGVGYETPELGHDWDLGSVTTTPTLEKEGEKTFTCKNCGDTYVESLPKLTLKSVTVSDVFVEKLNGNKNNLTITVRLLVGSEGSSETTEVSYTATFSIDNNAADTYLVGEYKVYVDTKGNTQIRECYIVS